MAAPPTRRVLCAALAGAAFCGCPEQAADVDSRCAPPVLDAGTLLRIDRTTESRIATDLMRELEAKGLTDPVAAVYEFSFMRNKPVFHFAVGRGSAEPQALLDEALRIFGGKLRPGGAARPQWDGDASFVCVDFDRKPGLVGRSAACSFSDGSISGYGVRIDGGEIDDTLRYTAEARRVHQKRAASRACTDATELAAQSAPRTDRDSVARDIVAAVAGYDCDLLAAHYESGAEAFLRANIDASLLRGSPDPVERVCFVLGTLEYPQVEDLAIDVASETPKGAVLHLRDGSRSARIFGDAKRRELVLSLASGAWKLDHHWALGQVQDLSSWLDLYTQASNLHRFLAETGTFTDDAQAVTQKTPTVARFERGMAGEGSPSDVIYVQGAGGHACASARSRSGSFFLARVEPSGYTFGRSRRPWSECPAQPLTGDWRAPAAGS